MAAALATARSRLAAFHADPARHARHAVKVLIKYHVMEERQLPLDLLLQWAVDTPMLGTLWRRFGKAHAPPKAWAEHFVRELVAAGVLALHEGVVRDV